MNEVIKEIYAAVLKHKNKLELHDTHDGGYEVEVVVNFEELSYRYRLPKPTGEPKDECED
jgi:hypothetical protein